MAFNQISYRSLIALELQCSIHLLFAVFLYGGLFVELTNLLQNRDDISMTKLYCLYTFFIVLLHDLKVLLVECSLNFWNINFFRSWLFFFRSCPNVADMSLIVRSRLVIFDSCLEFFDGSFIGIKPNLFHFNYCFFISLLIIRIC
jgi:hypothetical protein